MTIKKNVYVTINSKTRMVDFEDNFLGLIGENLQGYLVFKFEDEFVNGVPRVKIEKDGEKYVIDEVVKDEDTYKTLIKSSLLTTNTIGLQLVITEQQDPNGIPIFKSKKFHLNVAESIETEEEIPEQYDTWMDVANQKIIDINNAIAEVDNLDVDVSKENNAMTVTITKKDGTTKSESVLDGEKGDKGDTGEAGPSNTLSIGTVEKGDEANATITGVSPNQVLNLVLPKGDKGNTGDTGPQGSAGPSNTLSIGTVEKGENASATITGQSPNQTLNLVLPKGDKGNTGDNGTNIQSITKTSTSGLIDTYTVTLTDGSTTTFQVTNGNGIVSIEKTGTSGNIDTYTITLTNGTATTFTVTNSNDTELQNLTQRVTSINVFNPNAISDNCYISMNYGTETSSTSYFTTDYIPVEEGKILVASYNGAGVNMRFGATFDSSKNVIAGQGWNVNQKTYPISGQTVPQNAAYIRVSFSKTQAVPDVTKCMLEWNTTGNVSEFEPYRNDLQIKMTALPDEIQEMPNTVNTINTNMNSVVASQNVMEGKVNGIMTDYQTISSYNRFNPDTITENYYVNEATGKLSGNTNYISSDYISIVKDHIYAFITSNHWAVYNADKEFITAPTVATSGSYKYITASVDGYIRISKQKTESVMLLFEVNSSSDISYLPYTKMSYVENVYYDNVTIPKDKKEDYSFYLYNLIDSQNGINTGKYGDTTNASYDTTDFIPISAVPLTVYKQNLTTLSLRNVEYFDRDKIKIYSVDFPTGILATTPTIVQPMYIRICASTGTLTNTMTYPTGITPSVFLEYGNKIIKKSYIQPYLTASDAKVEALKGTNRLIATSATLTSGNSIELTSFPQHLKKGITYTADMNFTTFTRIRIGSGYNSYRGDWLEIDGTNVVYKHYEGSASTQATVAHGLTIQDALSIIMYVDNDGMCNISMATNGGNVNLQIQWMHEQNGSPFITGLQDMTNVQLSAQALDAKKPVWLFGDSFFGFASNRVMGQLQALGYTDNVLVSGMGGVGTSACLGDVQKLIALGGSPKAVVCCDGMNDNGTYYAQNLPGIISACESVGAELILYKVPVVTMRLTENTGVNEVVLASGKRYVDAYKAVGADGEGNWWTDYNADGVHPTEIGAKAIAQRIVIDVPEITQYGRTATEANSSVISDDFVIRS